MPGRIDKDAKVLNQDFGEDEPTLARTRNPELFIRDRSHLLEWH